MGAGVKTSHVTIQVRKIGCQNSNKKQLNAFTYLPRVYRGRQIDFDVYNNHDLLQVYVL